MNAIRKTGLGQSIFLNRAYYFLIFPLFLVWHLTFIYFSFLSFCETTKHEPTNHLNNNNHNSTTHQIYSLMQVTRFLDS